jgi:hypothetical protein
VKKSPLLPSVLYLLTQFSQQASAHSSASISNLLFQVSMPPVFSTPHQTRKIAEFLAKPEVKEMSAGLEEIA